MIADQNRIYDGSSTLEGGVDAGRTPSEIGPNQCVSAENMVFRGGNAATRPGFRKLAEVFTNPNHSYYANGIDAISVHVPGQEAELVYRNGMMQCAIGYSPHSGQDCIMAMIGGRMFKILPGISDARVTEVTPIRDKNSPFHIDGVEKENYRNHSFYPLAYMCQADKWLVVQDGVSRPILYDGHKALRSDNDNTDELKTQVPVGTIMAYGMGRLVVIVNERDVAFGDLYGSHDLSDPADSLIYFTERNFLAEGADAAIPFNFGKATGAEFFPQLDTSTGNGQFMVFAEKGASSFFLSLPRELWKTSQFQIVALRTTSMRGHRSIAIANEDLWFRSSDGFRSYRQARSEQSGWAHIPISTNVKQILEHDDIEMLKFASTIYFDNRIIATCLPAWNSGRVYHEGMVVVDFDILSSFGQKTQPSWDGNWTLGPRGRINLPHKVIQLFTGDFEGVTRAFAFGLEVDNNGGYVNQLFELTTENKNDWCGQKINWELVTRSFDFKSGSTPFNENTLYDGDIWLRDVTEGEGNECTP
jgi:hypothetical protein